MRDINTSENRDQVGAFSSLLFVDNCKRVGYKNGTSKKLGKSSAYSFAAFLRAKYPVSKTSIDKVPSLRVVSTWRFL